MIINPVRGGIVAACIGLMSFAAEAATVTDATFDLGGTFAWERMGYGFDGSFSGTLLGDPNIAREYDLGISIALSGKTIFEDSLPFATYAGGAFSITGAGGSLASAPGFGRLLGVLASVSDDVDIGSDSITGDFSFGLDPVSSLVLKLATCFSAFFDGCAHDGTYAIAMDLSYEAGDVVPAPLPAGLPLLATGLATFAAIRRIRR